MSLKEIRDSKGLTATFVSRELGITHRHYSRIEKTGLYITEERVKLLSNLFNTSYAKIRSCKNIGGIEIDQII